MPRPKGAPKTGGRKKGTPNRISGTVREQVLEALELAGGVKYLQKIADEDPRTFCALIGRVLPTQPEGVADEPVQLIVCTGVPRRDDT